MRVAVISLSLLGLKRQVWQMEGVIRHQRGCVSLASWPIDIVYVAGVCNCEAQQLAGRALLAGMDGPAA